MRQKLQNFIRDLQNSDEATKKAWLVGATAIVMIFVITLWSVYISYTVKNLNAEEKSSEYDLSFSTVFNTGVKMLGAETMDKIKEIIGKTESISVFEKNFDFTLDTLEEIQPKQLP